jgi:hypothetical protein
MFRSLSTSSALINELVDQNGTRVTGVTGAIESSDQQRWSLLLAMESVCHGVRRGRRS